MRPVITAMGMFASSLAPVRCWEDVAVFIYAVPRSPVVWLVSGLISESPAGSSWQVEEDKWGSACLPSSQAGRQWTQNPSCELPRRAEEGGMRPECLGSSDDDKEESCEEPGVRGIAVLSSLTLGG